MKSRSLFRLTRSEVELAGQRIPANQMVLAWTASANRDPAQFPDPALFAMEREPNRHLAFLLLPRFLKTYPCKASRVPPAPKSMRKAGSATGNGSW